MVIGILPKLQSVFEDTKSLNNLFHDPLGMKQFESCIGAENDFENILEVNDGRLEHCLALTFSESRPKRSSLLGWLVSDGKELDKVTNSLHSTIENYNANFENIKYWTIKLS